MNIIRRIISAICKLFCKAPHPKPKPAPTEAEIDAMIADIAREEGLQSLDWKKSVVDLLAVFRIPNTFLKRRQLYAKYGGVGSYNGSASQNIWLIQQIRGGFVRGEIGR